MYMHDNFIPVHYIGVQRNFILGGGADIIVASRFLKKFIKYKKIMTTSQNTVLFAHLH